jgi:hypothetical protein
VTTTYAPDHPRFAHAQRFAAQLNMALTHRKARPYHVYRAIGGGFSSYTFYSWRTGTAIPTMEKAIKLAEFLDWPSLLQITREARTGTCQRRGCGKAFTTEGGKTRIYCSPRCRQLAHEYDQRYAHAKRKKLGEDQAEQLRLAREHQAAEAELSEHRAAVAAFCHWCEPENVCRNPQCALRPVSPLPLPTPRTASADQKLQRPAHHKWAT